MTENGDKGRWNIRREQILLTLGILIIIFEVVSAEVLGRPYHAEILYVGLACCGIGIIQGVGRS